MRDIVDYKSEIAVGKFLGIKRDKKLSIIFIKEVLDGRETNKSIESGGVHVKRIGPRTELCGTPQVRGSEGET